MHIILRRGATFSLDNGQGGKALFTQNACPSPSPPPPLLHCLVKPGAAPDYTVHLLLNNYFIILFMKHCANTALSLTLGVTTWESWARTATANIH